MNLCADNHTEIVWAESRLADRCPLCAVISEKTAMDEAVDDLEAKLEEARDELIGLKQEILDLNSELGDRT